MLGRGAVAGGGVGDSAQQTRQQVQAASSRRADRTPRGRPDGAPLGDAVLKWWIRCPLPKGEALKGTSTRGDAEQTYKHRARSAGKSATSLRLRLCTKKYTSCTELRGCCDPGVPRALVYRGRRMNALSDDGLPGAAKNTGDESRLLFLIPPRPNSGLHELGI